MDRVQREFYFYDAPIAATITGARSLRRPARCISGYNFRYISVRQLEAACARCHRMPTIRQGIAHWLNRGSAEIPGVRRGQQYRCRHHFCDCFHHHGRHCRTRKEEQRTRRRLRQAHTPKPGRILSTSDPYRKTRPQPRMACGPLGRSRSVLLCHSSAISCSRPAFSPFSLIQLRRIQQRSQPQLRSAVT